MVKVKLFANFREIAGKSEIELEAETVFNLLVRLTKIYPELKDLTFENDRPSEYVNVVVNGRFISDYSMKLNKDDIVAIFPPVSGG